MPDPLAVLQGWQQMHSRKCKYIRKKQQQQGGKRENQPICLWTAAPQGKWQSEDTNLCPQPSTPKRNKPELYIEEIVLQSKGRVSALTQKIWDHCHCQIFQSWEKQYTFSVPQARYTIVHYLFVVFTFRRTKIVTLSFSCPIIGTTNRKVSVSSTSSLGLIVQGPSAEVQKKISAVKVSITYSSSSWKMMLSFKVIMRYNTRPAVVCIGH